MFVQTLVPFITRARRPVVPEGLSRGPPGKEGGFFLSLFSCFVSSNYWSSTTYVDNPDNAWNVNLNDGNVNANDKTNTNYVWPVRSGK